LEGPKKAVSFAHLAKQKGGNFWSRRGRTKWKKKKGCSPQAKRGSRQTHEPEDTTERE